MKIGAILAGAASKGVYELGVMQALEDYFGPEAIRCVSSASIGMLVAQSFGMGCSEELIRMWKGLGKKRGGTFLSLCDNQQVLSEIHTLFSGGGIMGFEHYVSVWNFSRRRAEYIPFHQLSGEQLRQYTRAAIAIPLFSHGEKIGGDRIFDGAFVDNIPAYPLVGKDLDFVFCVYFDHCGYTFEGPEFDRKVIKLFDFPNHQRLELMSFDPEAFDSKVRYGYDYGMRVIRTLFEGREGSQIYEAIAQMERNRRGHYKPRLTADVVLHNINVFTGKYARRLTNREKTTHRNP